MKQKKFVKDYKVIINEKGKKEYLYQGPLYSITQPEIWKNYIITTWGLAILNTVLFLLLGFVNNDGSRQMYISIPFVALLFPVAMLWVDAYKVTFHKKPMERMTYIQGFLHSRKMSVTGGIISSLGAVGEAIYLLLGTSTTQTKEWIVLLTFVVFAGANWMFFVLARRVKLKEHH
ncbi:MAG: hypothetical protein GX786_08040 [Clostridiales bacterium]|nr:hypothetical protein [Clostridiales bacterium]